MKYVYLTASVKEWIAFGVSRAVYLARELSDVLGNKFQ
jgi:hypothetical protein